MFNQCNHLRHATWEGFEHLIQEESKRIINRKCICDNEKCTFSTAKFAHYIPKSLTDDEVKTWLRDQSDQITTNQGRPPLILMSNFNKVATATRGDTLSAEEGGGARTSVPVPLAPASDSRSDAETTKVQELTEALEKLQVKLQLHKDKIGTLSKEVHNRDKEIETLRSTIGKMSWKQLKEDEEFRNKRFPTYTGFLNGDCVIALWNIFQHYVPVYELLPVYNSKYRTRSDLPKPRSSKDEQVWENMFMAFLVLMRTV
ncbi:unnamed protein product [Bathycoccus prasinos]